MRGAIASLVMTGFEGRFLSPFLERAVRDTGVGGVIFLKRNAESGGQVSSLCREILSLSPHDPPLLAVDQEGGRVSRVGVGLSVLPGNMALGASRAPELARRAGMMTALQIRSLGLNLNLAPVLDVISTPQNRVIGTRSFGDDPRLVGQLGGAYIGGTREGGALSAAKHFPGLGRARFDPHFEHTPIEASLEDLAGVDMMPFREAVPRRPDFVMMSHASYACMDAVPATLSGKVMGDFLRRDLGYGGAIISDDLCMKAISGRTGVGDAAVSFLAGGGDMVLVCDGEETLEEVIRAVEVAVGRGLIPREDILKKVERLEAARSRAGRPAGDFDRADLEGLSLEIAEASVTAGRMEAGVLPLGEGPLLVVETGYPGVRSRLAGLVRGRGVEVEPLLVEPVPSEEEIRMSAAAAARARSSIVVTCDCFHYTQQLKLVEAVAGGCGSVACIAAGSPYDLSRIAGAGAALATYSLCEASMTAAVGVLFGERAATGTLPVKL